jgi:hypothetical protein
VSGSVPPSDRPPVEVSIVVPVRNEAENIAPLVTEIAAALGDRWLYEIIYVNDGSTDATADRLTALMQQRRNLRHIRHAESRGQSAAVRTGVRAARGSIVATLDGDGQNNPASCRISSWLWSMAAKASGSRPGNGSGARTPASRNCNRASPTACVTASCATARAIPDAASRRSDATYF